MDIVDVRGSRGSGKTTAIKRAMKQDERASKKSLSCEKDNMPSPAALKQLAQSGVDKLYVEH